MSSDTSPSRRLTVTLTEKELLAFDALIDEGGMQKRKDVYDNAMTLLHWAAGEVRRGRDICSVDRAGKGKEVEVLRTPMFDMIKVKSRGA